MYACMYNMYVCIRWQLVACGAGSLSGIERTVWRGEVMQNSLFTEDNSYIHLFTNVLMYIHTYIHNKHITYINTVTVGRIAFIFNEVFGKRLKAFDPLYGLDDDTIRTGQNPYPCIMHLLYVCMYVCLYVCMYVCTSSCSHSCLRSHNLIELLVFLSAIANAKGTRFSLFVPERSFDVLVRIHT